MVAHSHIWINGVPRESCTGKTFEVINSVSQAVVTQVAAASSEDAIAAIIEADKAQVAWEATSWRVRQDVFIKAAQLVQTPRYVQKVHDAVIQELAGLPAWAKIEIRGVYNHFLFAAEEATKLRGETFPSELYPESSILVEKRAFGTVFAMTAFNSPIFLAARSVCVPLVCGNSVVLKSSELTPRCSEIVVELLHEAGLPKGVLNLIHIAPEDAPEIVSEIIGHKLIRHVNFTGSDRVGRIIATEAGKHIKPCVLELGSKSPVLVLNDANLENAAQTIFQSATANGGQICLSTERVIVQREIADALFDRLIETAQKVKAGPDADIAPLVTSSSASRVLDLVKDAKEKGGRVIVGDLNYNGSVLQPHIIVGVEPGWQIWDRESFGPVFGIKIVDTEEEGVQFANMSEYSLSAAIWTQDAEKGLRLSRQIRAGQVLINGPTVMYEPSLGVHGLGGATGYGSFDVENFTQKRSIFIIPALSTKL